ncbi:hypothetical protein [Flavonifractor sp. An10]|nr:hypothetical protein [Flavonifractor sp. An10]
MKTAAHPQQTNLQFTWRVSRCFDGDKTPEDLLRALIQAHSK